MHGLSETFRATALGQLCRIAEEVADASELPSVERIDTLYAALDNIVRVIERLAPRLPDLAPELWVDRKNRSETPVEFINRVYGKYLNSALTKSDIRHLDINLYWSMLKFEAAQVNNTGIRLMTEEERNSRALKLIADAGGHLDLVPASTLLKVRPVLTTRSLARMRKIRAKKLQNT